MPTRKILAKYRELLDSMKESFSLKVFKSFAVSIMLVFIAFTLFFVRYERRAVKEDLIKEGKMLAGLMAYSSTTGVFAENRDLIKDSVEGIMSQRNVLSVTIFTADNRVLLAEEKDPTPTGGGLLTDYEKRTSPSPGDARPFKVIEGEETIGVVCPVIMAVPANPEESLYFETGAARKPEIIGYAKVVLDKKVLNKQMAGIMLNNAVIALLFLVLSAAVTYLLIRRVTRPLTRLTEAVRRFGMGESVEKVPVESTDEVGKLAATFNTMSENLMKREEEKRALEEKLRYAQKMEAVGTLARGIAHDFNNILSTVRGSVYILEKKLFDQSPLRQYIEQIHNSLNKAKNLIGGLVAFSRIQTIHPYRLNVNTLVAKLKPVLVSIAGEGIDLRLSLSEEELFITADSIQIEQVLMNLCANARDAMPDGGILTITTEPAIIDAADGGDGAPIRSGKYAVISVSDTGTGIDDTIKEKIFEPFFTTKEVGKGTGLGLAIIYGIIEQYRGQIEIDTAAEKGTTFRVYMPMDEGDAEERKGDNLS